MTNKTSEKRWEKNFDWYWKQLLGQVVREQTLIDTGEEMKMNIKKLLKQSNNRILRKWKKGMEILIGKILSDPEHFRNTYTPKEVVEFFVRYFIDKDLKAKKEIEG